MADSGLINMLPTEVLSQIFQLIADEERSKHRVPSTQKLRLVSQRFNSIASAILFSAVSVRLTSKSFSNLERISEHNDLNKFVKEVRINTSFFEEKVGQDFGLFVEFYGAAFNHEILRPKSRHSRDLDKADFLRRLDDLDFLVTQMRQDEFSGASQRHITRSYVDEKRLKQIDPQILQMRKEEFSKKYAIFFRQALLEVHEEYKSLLADQQAIRSNNNHITRMCVALIRFTALKSIVLTDEELGRQDFKEYIKEGAFEPDDPRNFRIATSTLGWHGSEELDRYVTPPVEMLGELLSRLGKAGVRPQELKLKLAIPLNLQRAVFSAKQTRRIQKLVSRSTNIEFIVRSWAHENSWSDFECRPYREMRRLGTMTMALTNAPHLESLKISFGNYPAVYEFPAVHLGEFVSLSTMTWPNLKHLDIDSVPCDLADMRQLASLYSSSLKSFTAIWMYIRQGSWSDAIDELRKLRALEHFKFEYPRGRMRDYDEPNHREKDFPTKHVHAYVMKQTSENPFRSGEPGLIDGCV